MNGEAMTVERRDQATRMAFPERANPNRPAHATGEPWRETRGEARSFSDRSDPRHAHRPLTEEQRELVTYYMPMARDLAQKSGFWYVAVEELEAEAYAGLVDAARAFDPTRGVSFAMYARPRIVGAIRQYIRFLYSANWRGERSDAPIFQRMARSENLHGRLIGVEEEAPAGQDFELSESVASMMRRLPRSQKLACRSLYFEGKSPEETAAEMGCSRGYFSRIHNAALERLRSVGEELLTR